MGGSSPKLRIKKLETSTRACASAHPACKILLRSTVTSFRSVEVFHDCSGGNSRPSRPSGVGGGIFAIFLICHSSLIRHSSLVRRHSVLRSGRFSWPVAFTLISLISAIVALVIFLRLETWPARTAQQGTAGLERLGKNLRAAFIDIAHLQPRISINDRVYMEQTTPVSELVVLSRRIEVEHELLHTWVGSSKRVKLHGTFIAKAGFDLRKGLSIDIRPAEITVQLPHEQILGVEQQQMDVLAF